MGVIYFFFFFFLVLNMKSNIKKSRISLCQKYCPGEVEWSGMWDWLLLLLLDWLLLLLCVCDTFSKQGHVAYQIK